MQKLGVLAVGLALAVGFWALVSTNATAQINSDDPRIALADQCDPATFPSGLCVATPHTGAVTFAEFGALLFSSLIATVVGHPAWRFEPSFVDLKSGHTLRVTNNGGENHTFTEVAAFGGGFVPPLNGVGVAGKVPLTPAAACVPPPGTAIVAPGSTMGITVLAPRESLAQVGVSSIQRPLHWNWNHARQALHCARAFSASSFKPRKKSRAWTSAGRRIWISLAVRVRHSARWGAYAWLPSILHGRTRRSR